MPGEPDLEGLFPEGVVPELRPVGEPADGEVREEERALVRDAAPKRRQEFLTGRAAARRALARLGAPTGPLLANPDRSPAWPEGVVGSIAHGGGMCLAAVAPRAVLGGLGVDLEPHAALDEALWPRICAPEELERLRAEPAERRGTLARAVFCAKEAAYKCQFPLTRTFLGFQDVGVEWDAALRAFRLRLRRAPGGGGPPLPGGFARLIGSLEGTWRSGEGLLIASVHRRGGGFLC